MTNAFSSLISDTRLFLTDLASNNNRDWFLANKAKYNSSLKRPAELLLEQTRADLSKSFGVDVKPKLFRAHRDVRFSKDKTPYHLHLHMLWTADTGGPQPLGFFFGIGLDYVSAGVGFMGFDKNTQILWRETVAGPAGAELSDLLNAFKSSGYRIGDPELKRVPSPYEKDHPQAELLKRKSLSVWKDFQADQVLDPPDVLLDSFNALKPLITKLSDLS